MSKVSERALVMMKNFMRLYKEEGYSITEIAKKYGLCRKTVYLHLQQIAVENGLPSRDALLKIVRNVKPEEKWRSEEKEEKEKVYLDMESLKKGYTEVSATIGRLIAKVEETVEEDCYGE